MIDLHTHSRYSDGSYTPGELVDLAVDAGLSAIALTDHDTTGGISEFLAACAEKSINGIGGVEISADFQPGTMHVLGYFVQPGNAELEAALQRIRNGRKDRNTRMIELLGGLGIHLELEDVQKHAGAEVMGRPHFAKALVEAGHVDTTRQAFDKYLAKGRPAYADRFRLSPEECIRRIRGAGGIVCLAHPFTLQLEPPALREVVQDLTRHGLQGIEVYYSEHNAERTRQYNTLAGDFGLIATGGTDFHGEINPDIKIGRGFGPLAVSDDIYRNLCRLAGR